MTIHISNGFKLYLILINLFAHKVICQFTPLSDEICLGDSISYNCTLVGSFSSLPSYIYKHLIGLNIHQLNSMMRSGVDLSRVSATSDFILDQVSGDYTFLTSNITVVNISKDDNGTLIGCSAVVSGTISNVTINSEVLTLSSPPSSTTLNLTPIPSNCTVMLNWNTPYSQLPIIGYNLSYNILATTNNIELNKDATSYFTPPLPAGENIRFNLTARSCVGESALATVLTTVPSRPNFNECSATYGIMGSTLVIKIRSSLQYYAVYEYNISESNNPSLALYSGNFTTNKLNIFHSKIVKYPIIANQSYNVSIRARLSHCEGSESTNCIAPLNITTIAPTMLITTPMSTTMAPTSFNITPNATTTIPIASIPIVYITIAVVLFLVLFCLVNVIIVLILILRKNKISKFRSFPVQRLSDSPDLPKAKDGQPTNPDGTELHYLKPKFSNAVPPPKFQPLPKTLYTDIDHAKSTIDGSHYAHVP